MKERTSFEQFLSAFSIVGVSMKRDELDAEYREKMSKKNISVVDLRRLERDYNEKLQRLSNDSLRLSMNPKFPLSRNEATNIMNSIPAAWFRIYSKLEARQFPQIETAELMRTFGERGAQSGYLVLMEKARLYCRSLQNLCNTLNGMLEGRVVSLPSGEYLGDFQKQLESIINYQVNVVRQYVLVYSGYLKPFDRVYLDTRLRAIELDLIRVNTRYNGVMDALAILQEKSLTKTSDAAASAGSGPQNSPSVNLQFDESFFNMFTAMVRNDVNNELRASYAEKAMEFGEIRANLEADKCYYEQLLAITGKNNAPPSVEKDVDLESIVRKLYQDMSDIGKKITQFQNMVTGEYLSSRMFYAPAGTVQYRSEYLLPFKRICLGLLAVWVMFNLIYCVCGFYQMKGHGLLNNKEA